MEEAMNMKYNELRKLAKTLGLSSNGKKEQLIESIKKHYEDAEGNNNNIRSKDNEKETNFQGESELVEESINLKQKETKQKQAQKEILTKQIEEKKLKQRELAEKKLVEKEMEAKLLIEKKQKQKELAEKKLREQELEEERRKQKELQEAEEQRQREFEVEQQKQRLIEAEKQRERELEEQKEIEAKKQKEMELAEKKQREKDLKAEKKLREKKELETERHKQAEEQRQRELEEKKRKIREIEAEKQRERDLEEQKEIEAIKQKEMELAEKKQREKDLKAEKKLREKKELETERQKQAEEQRQRELEEKERKIREIEAEKQRERELEEQKEIEAKKQKEMELAEKKQREKDLKAERQKQKEIQAREIEEKKQRQKEFAEKKSREKEMQAKQLEEKKQKQQELAEMKLLAEAEEQQQKQKELEADQQKQLDEANNKKVIKKTGRKHSNNNNRLEENVQIQENDEIESKATKSTNNNRKTVVIKKSQRIMNIENETKILNATPQSAETKNAKLELTNEDSLLTNDESGLASNITEDNNLIINKLTCNSNDKTYECLPIIGSTPIHIKPSINNLIKSKNKMLLMSHKKRSISKEAAPETTVKTPKVQKAEKILLNETYKKSEQEKTEACTEEQTVVAKVGARIVRPKLGEAEIKRRSAGPRIVKPKIENEQKQDEQKPAAQNKRAKKIISTKKPNPVAIVSKTPKSSKIPDFKTLHKKIDEKMEPIDEYAKRIREKHETLINFNVMQEKKTHQSPSKGKTAREVIESQLLFTEQTAVTSSNIPRPQPKTTSLIAEPMKMNCRTPKTPINRTTTADRYSKTPKSIVASALKKKASVLLSAKKDNYRQPFFFHNNNNANVTSSQNCTNQNTSVCAGPSVSSYSKRKSFDINASLARPLTYNPHNGRLKPVAFNSKSIFINKHQQQIKNDTSLMEKSQQAQRRISILNITKENRDKSNIFHESLKNHSNQITGKFRENELKIRKNLKESNQMKNRQLSENIPL